MKASTSIALLSAVVLTVSAVHAEEKFLGYWGPTAYYSMSMNQPLSTNVASFPLPESFNWDRKGMVTPAKDQGACGSCWAFSACATYESKIMMKGWGAFDIAEEQQVECNTDMGGCAGGNEACLRFWETRRPMDENCAMYTQGAGNCSNISGCQRILRTNGGYYTANPNAVDEVKKSVYIDGPAFYGFRVYQDFIRFWNSASSGDIYQCGSDRGQYKGGHAVTIIGWDDEQSAYLCKNSWGEYSGPNGDGTFWIAYDGHAVNVHLCLANMKVDDGNIWAVDEYKNIYRTHENSTWQQVQGKAIAIEGDIRGNAWCVSSSSGIVFRNTPDRGWQSVRGINAQDISSASSGVNTYVYATDTRENIYRLNGGKWQRIQGLAVRCDVDHTGTLWAVNRSGMVWKLEPGKPWKHMSGITAQDVGSDGDGVVYATGTNRYIYKLKDNGSGWVRIQGLAERVDVDRGGRVYVANRSGMVWTQSPSSPRWRRIDGITAKDVGCAAWN